MENYTFQLKELTSVKCLLPCWYSDSNYTGEMELRARFLYTEKFPKFPRYTPDRTARFRNTLALNFHFVLALHLLLALAALSDFLLQAL